MMNKLRAAISAMVGAGVLLMASCASTPQPSADPITEWAGEPLTAEQLPYGADGIVTKSELHEAYLSAAACMGEQGYSGTVNEGLNGGYSMTAMGPTDSLEAVEAAYFACQERYVGVLDAIYQFTNLPSIEERETKFLAWQQCIDRAGFSFDGIILGDEQSVMIDRLIELNGPVENWPGIVLDCNEEYYFVLWPETLGGPEG